MTFSQSRNRRSRFTQWARACREVLCRAVLRQGNVEDAEIGNRFESIEQASGHLNPGGRIFLFCGTSGDVDYLTSRIERERFAHETVATRALLKDGLTVTYSTQRLTR